MPAPTIDREKLRTFVHKLRKGDHLLLLDRAIDLLPNARLHRLVEGYANPKELAPDIPPTPTDLVAKARAFHDASLRGEYYESFAVNSKNCMEKSGGTDRFIVDCERLLGLCIKHSRGGDHAEAADSFELIFAVLRQIDECRDGVIFFADEGGSWQVGVDWRAVFPAWFKSLAATTDPDDFAAKVVLEVDHHVRHDRDRYMKMARKAATAAQRKALEECNRES